MATQERDRRAHEPQPLRIAVVGPTFPYKGGVAQHTTELAHELASRGHSVTLESWLRQYPERLYPGQQRVDRPESPVFPRTRYPLSWNRPGSWWRLGRRLRATTDLVVLVLVTPVQAPALLVLRAPLGRAVNVLALCHNVLPHERRRLDQVLVRSVLRRVDRVLVHSEQESSLAAALTAAPVTVAAMPPHGIARHRAEVTARDPDRPASRVLLFFGLVRPYKGLDVLLRALAVGPPDVSLVVAGEFWGGVESTRTLVEDLGLTSRVELRPGYVDAEDVPELLAACDALVLPYRASTSSQNVALAHRAGVPVVATRVGTMADQLHDGVDGLLCEPEDVAGLSEALRRLYDDGTLPRLRRGIAAHDDDGDWDRYVRAVVQSAQHPAPEQSR